MSKEAYHKFAVESNKWHKLNTSHQPVHDIIKDSDWSASRRKEPMTNGQQTWLHKTAIYNSCCYVLCELIDYSNDWLHDSSVKKKELRMLWTSFSQSVMVTIPVSVWSAVHFLKLGMKFSSHYYCCITALNNLSRYFYQKTDAQLNRATMVQHPVQKQ